MDQEQRHPATPQRLAQAQRDGDCFYSAQLAITMYSVLAVVAIASGLGWAGQSMLDWLGEYWRRPAAHGESGEALRGIALRLGIPLACGMAALWCACWMLYLWQTGWVWGRKPLATLSHWGGPLRANAMSLRRGGSQLLAILQVLTILAVLIGLTLFRGEVLLQLWSAEPSRWPSCLLQIGQQWVAPLMAAVAAISVVDYFWHRAMFRRSLRMTDEQLREELRGESRKR